MPITKSINRVTTITDYIQRIIKIQDLNEQADNHAELIFRGQSTDEPLLPRLARLALRNETETLKKTEELILAEFKRGMLPLSEFKPDNSWDLLALAQHHGLPTRLLDWTYSALAALWFTVENAPQKNDHDKSEDGVVWVLAAQVDDFRIDTNNSDPLKKDITKIFRSNVVSRRISAQAGLFTVHYIRKDGSIREFEKHSRFKDKLTKIIIPYGSFPKLRKQLSLSGINHSTLFPDLDGLSKHLKWRFSRYKDE